MANLLLSMIYCQYKTKIREFDKSSKKSEYHKMPTRFITYE